MQRKLLFILAMLVALSAPLFSDELGDLHRFDELKPWERGSALIATRTVVLPSDESLNRGQEDEIMEDVTKGMLFVPATGGGEHFRSGPSTNIILELLVVADAGKQRREMVELEEDDYEELMRTGYLSGKCFTLFIQTETNQNIHTCFMNERYEIDHFPGTIYTPPFLRFARNAGVLGPYIWSRIHDGALRVNASDQESGIRLVSISGPINDNLGIDMQLMLHLDPERGYIPTRIERWIGHSFASTQYKEFIPVNGDEWYPGVTTETSGFLAAGKTQTVHQTEYRVIQNHVIIEDRATLNAIDIYTADSIAEAMLISRP